MKGSSLQTVARVCAFVLGGLALLGAFDTATLIASTADELSTGRVIACVLSAVVSIALGWGAVRMWQRGATPPDGLG